jgi:hypothetical protein
VVEGELRRSTRARKATSKLGAWAIQWE